MRYSKIKHFWAWFKENHHHYTGMLTKETKEAEYWHREIRAHLDAYAKGITAEFLWKKEPDAYMIITLTSGGKSKFFKRIDNLVAKAPVIAGCSFEALRQPGSLKYHMDYFEKQSVDPHNIWFDPKTITEGARGSNLDVFVEHYGEMTDDYQYAVISVIYNIIGERLYGWGINDICVDTLIGVNPLRKERLINVLELPRHLKVTELSSLEIGYSGTLRNKG